MIKAMHDQKNVLTLSLLSSEDIKAHLPAILSYLTEEERARASRYAREEDRLMSAGGAYLIRRKLGRDAIVLRTDEGKPYAEDHVRFNLSHSCGLVAAVFGGKNEIGVDVEKIRDGFDDLRTHVLTQPELDSGLDFFTLFTAKESLSKAAGTGLLPSPKDFPALPPDGRRGRVGLRARSTGRSRAEERCRAEVRSVRAGRRAAEDSESR